MLREWATSINLYNMETKKKRGRPAKVKVDVHKNTDEWIAGYDAGLHDGLDSAIDEGNVRLMAVRKSRDCYRSKYRFTLGAFVALFAMYVTVCSYVIAFI